jgi:hypothetical protein
VTLIPLTTAFFQRAGRAGLRHTLPDRCALPVVFYHQVYMPAISFSNLLAQFSGNKAAALASPARTSTLLYATTYSRADDALHDPPRYFEITTAPDADCAVYLTLSDGTLEAWPSAYDPDAMPQGEPTEFHAPLWLVMLCRLCEESISPHIESLHRIPFFEGDQPNRPNFTKLRCGQVLDDLIENFRFQRRAFFPSREKWFEWECWSHSGSWLKNKISPSRACEIIEVDTGTHRETMRQTLKACASAAKAHIKLSENEWIDAATPLTPPFTPANAVVNSVMEPYVKPPLLGGDPDLQLPRDPDCIHAAAFTTPDKRIQEPPRAFWWWQKLKSRDEWPDDLSDLFRQNWARSAFLYEFRCRRNRKNERPWFGVPWITLDHVQRAILRELWPPEVAGSKTVVRPSVSALSNFGKLSRFPLQIQVDLATMSDGAIIEQVQAILKQERINRNFPGFTQGQGRVQTDYRWSILEAMDEAFYKGQTLLAKDRTGKAAIEKSYKAACEEAGIDPDGPAEDA